ncbi:hypothetical protein H0H81_002612 [Sphagnurus paluster]|uniref:Sec23/Sec24 trunk domain-containing protein n=1 Tax=Sphagnurus paluster TaxID=117069 RepID=A0A9P7GTX6_9AGAR|nr:hypothetical protein H0H81_002612 [Sphagnurus paluster]
MSLDANLMRLDHLQRPELNKGTVDFAVPKEYWAINPPEGFIPSYYAVEPRIPGPRAPAPPKYIFAFDVSREAVQSGLLRAACACVRTILYGGAAGPDGTLDVDACFPPQCSLAIITYDSTLHFYDLSVRAPLVSSVSHSRGLPRPVRSRPHAGRARYRRGVRSFKEWSF